MSRISPLLLVLAMSACNTTLPPMPPVGPFTRVVVVDDRSVGAPDTLAVISEPARLAALAAYVDARRAEWEQPWYGIPVPQVSAYLYTAGGFAGHVGAGPNFLEVQRLGTFASRSASRAELQEFARLLGVSASRFQLRR
jgi:hypothetical protein